MNRSEIGTGAATYRSGSKALSRKQCRQRRQRFRSEAVYLQMICIHDQLLRVVQSNAWQQQIVGNIPGLFIEPGQHHQVRVMVRAVLEYPPGFALERPVTPMRQGHRDDDLVIDQQARLPAQAHISGGATAGLHLLNYIVRYRLPPSDIYRPAGKPWITHPLESFQHAPEVFRESAGGGAAR